MKKIISVSRRTDIPAFYGEWFINRIKEGNAGYINPFGGQRYLISLRPEEVACFLFISKNFLPFIDKLPFLENSGYNFYFNYTITGLPRIIEAEVIDAEAAIKSFIKISQRYSPKHIIWRYDPIVISDLTDRQFHLKNFRTIAENLAGYVDRCYISFVTHYGKVKRNFNKFQEDTGIAAKEPEIRWKQELANELAEIAKEFNIGTFSCCGDYLINGLIKKACCVDGDLIKDLFLISNNYRQKPTRKECGCTVSTDIGTYDTCPHGCIYCYANLNKQRAADNFQNHDVNAAFLGFNKKDSDGWIAEIREKIRQKEQKVLIKEKQLGLF